MPENNTVGSFYTKQINSNIDNDRNAILEHIKEEKRDSEQFLRKIAPEYMGVYVLDKETDRFRDIIGPGYFRQIVKEKDGRYSEALKLYRDRYVLEEEWHVIDSLLDYDQIYEILRTGQEVNVSYRKTDGTLVNLKVGQYSDLEKDKNLSLWIYTDSGIQYKKQLGIDDSAANILMSATTTGSWYIEYGTQGKPTKYIWSNAVRHLLNYESQIDFPDTWESLLDKVHPDDRTFFNETYENTQSDYSGKAIFDIEYRMRNKQGDYHWFRNTAHFSRGADGTPICANGIITLVEQQHDLDRRLRQAVQNEQQHRKQLEKQHKQIKEQLSIFAALAATYTNVYLIEVNTGKIKILKLNGYITTGLDKVGDAMYDYDTVKQQYVSERVYPDDQAMMNEALSLERVKRKLISHDEYTGSYRALMDGEAHYYQFKYVKLKRVDHIIAGFQNIDEIVADEQAHQKQLEEQLAIFDILSRNYRNIYLANINDGTAKILKVAEDYDLQEVLKQKNKVFPYEQVLNLWIEKRVHVEDKERLRHQLSVEHLREVLAGQESEYSGTYRSIDGGKMHNYQFYVAKMNDSGAVIAGFQFIDKIIEQHLAQEREQRERETAYQKKLFAAKLDAERANRAKTDFLLRMSHDIRTPLNGIIGMLDIADRYTNDLEQRDDCRKKIRESSQILLELINEVLDMNKLESGKVVLEHIPFDLIDISRGVFSVVLRQAETRGIELIEEDCHAIHPQLIGSPIHFKRIMTNILSNAIKYNRDNGRVYISCREVSSDENIAHIEFKCRDTGLGMEAEFLEHIFEPFVQENTTPRSRYGGTGLGMSIAKNLTDKMGGTITVESQKGVGTTFDVIIPFEIDRSESKEILVDIEAEAPSIRGVKILLAEDNELNMEIAKFLLEEYGAHIIEAENGQEAVEMFAKSAPFEIDAILMDIMMPLMDGYEATRTIRKMNRPDTKQIPIIAMTASAFAEDRIAARQAGMTEHLVKPLDTKLVIKTIAQSVSLYRGTQP